MKTRFCHRREKLHVETACLDKVKHGERMPRSSMNKLVASDARYLVFVVVAIVSLVLSNK